MDVEGGNDAAGAEEEEEEVAAPTTAAPTGETTEGGGADANPPTGGATFATWMQADPESLQDLVDMIMSAADDGLKGVYGGDTIHPNDGRHLCGGIDEATDKQHQTWMDRVFAHPHSLYYPPRCAIGKRFIEMLALLFEGVRLRKWNSELPMRSPSPP